MHLPVELVEHILSFCLPRDTSGNVSLYSEKGETKLRLVCRLFDETWSRDLVMCAFSVRGLFNSDISENWPLDSTMWLVRTLVMINYRKRHGNQLLQRDSLYCVLAAVDALHWVITGLPGEEDGTQDGIEQAISLASTVLVLNHEFNDIIKRISPQIWRNRPIKLQRRERFDPEAYITNLLPLLAASQNADLVRDILARYGNVDINYCSELFGCAIYNAAALNDVDMVKLLLAHGADVNQTGGRWHTPCHASCAYSGATDALSTLLEAGADANLQDVRFQTALIIASMADHWEAVAILLSHPGVNVNLTDSLGRSILHHLCRAGDVDNVRSLLAQHPNIDVHHESESGTALHMAMNLEYDEFSDGHDEIVAILLDRGLSPKAVSWGSETSIIGWAENIKDDAECYKEEVPAAAQRILRWRDAWERGHDGSTAQNAAGAETRGNTRSSSAEKEFDN